MESVCTLDFVMQMGYLCRSSQQMIKIYVYTGTHTCIHAWAIAQGRKQNVTLIFWTQTFPQVVGAMYVGVR